VAKQTQNGSTIQWEVAIFYANLTNKLSPQHLYIKTDWKIKKRCEFRTMKTSDIEGTPGYEESSAVCLALNAVMGIRRLHVVSAVNTR
jgi:hypothetical protein